MPSEDLKIPSDCVQGGGMLADNPADDGGLGGNSKSTTSIAQELIGFVTQSFWHSWTALLTAMVLFPSQMTGKPPSANPFPFS